MFAFRRKGSHRWHVANARRLLGTRCCRAPHLDPADARAKLIRFSKRGKAGILEGLAILKEVESELETVVGAPAMKTMHDALAKIVHHELRLAAERDANPQER